MKLPLLTSVAFAIASGIYWYILGQFLSVIPPMMLDDWGLLLRVVSELSVALVFYVCGALAFFRWLLRRSRNV